MGHTEHHLEEAEHAAGHGHGHGGGGLERYVAVSMAIVAAVLAWVTLMSHRGHNSVLSLQSESNRHQTQANVFHTKASDQWSFYQAKNGRSQSYMMLKALLETMPASPEVNEKRAKLAEEWEKKIRKYEEELPEMKKEAEKLVHEGEEQAHESTEALEKSEHAHHQADRFDLAELCVELALVLCSLTVLTKRGVFFGIGLLMCAIGVALAGSAFMLH